MKTPRSPAAPDTVPGASRISMTADEFRWTLMWHTSVVRDLTLIEVERDGCEMVRERTKRLDRRRKALLQRLAPPAGENGT